MTDTVKSRDIEGLLRSALAPVDPPEDMVAHLEDTLSEITLAAAEELSDWEVASMRDPRNWVKPATAVAAGAVAGGALLLVRSRKRHGGRSDEVSDLIKEALKAGRRTAKRCREEAGSAVRGIRSS